MARLQGRVRVNMPQCYGTCLKTSELAAMSYAFDDWGLDASMEEVRARLGKWMVTEEDEGFEAHALALFRWQAYHNPTYRAFVQALRIEPREVSRVEDIPFMPVEMFVEVCLNGVHCTLGSGVYFTWYNVSAITLSAVSPASGPSAGEV